MTRKYMKKLQKKMLLVSFISLLRKKKNCEFKELNVDFRELWNEGQEKQKQIFSIRLQIMTQEPICLCFMVKNAVLI